MKLRAIKSEYCIINSECFSVIIGFENYNIGIVIYDSYKIRVMFIWWHLMILLNT